MATRIYLTRHGQTEWNLQKRMQGHKNSDLTSLGKEQAKALGLRMKDVELNAIYTSSLPRAMQTAELIRGKNGIPVIPDDNLREIYLGCWEGMLFDEVEKKYPAQFDNFWNHPEKYVPVDGESFNDLRIRVGKALLNIAKQNSGKDVLVVAHGIVIKALYTYFRNQPIAEIAHSPYTHSACLCEIVFNPPVWDVMKWNDTDHYKYIEETK